MSKKFLAFLFMVSNLLLVACTTQGWVQVFPKNNPPTLANSAVAYMISSQSAILFGGITPSIWSDETWIWNGQTWTQDHPLNSPPAREKTAMVYDVSRDRVVLFGGVMDKTLFDDTWEWDGKNWHLMNPAHKPPARCCHAMAYDNVNKDILMYGGYDPTNNSFFGDAWRWDGTDWTLVSCCDMSQMSGHAMVGFPAKNEIVSVEPSGQGTWVWTGALWKKLLINNPPERSEGRIAYDSNSNRAVFYGGSANGQVLGDTWVFDGSSWQDVSLPNNPPARWGAVMFYDPILRSIVLFGGMGVNNTRLNDTWELRLPQDISGLVSKVQASATP